MDSVSLIFLTGADGDCGEKFSPALHVHLCSVCGEVSPTNCPQSDASEVSFTHELPSRGGESWVQCFQVDMCEKGHTTLLALEMGESRPHLTASLLL